MQQLNNAKLTVFNHNEALALASTGDEPVNGESHSHKVSMQTLPSAADYEMQQKLHQL